MKHTRILTMILVIALLIAMVGCQKAPTEKAVSVTSESNGNAPTETNASVESTLNTVQKSEDKSPADTSRTEYITSKEDFTKVIGSLVDLTLYKDLEVSDSSCFYSLKSDNEFSYDFDHKITLSDGSEFSLNVPFAELEAQGWVLSEPERELDSGYMSWFTCNNSAGQELYIGICNLSENTLTAKECVVCSIEFTMFSSIDFSEAINTTPGFTICKTITQTSSLEDIIAQLGTPGFIRYGFNDSLDSDILLEYVQPDNAYENLSFTLSADGNYIVDIDYEYVPN